LCGLAEKQGLKVMPSAAIDKRLDNNEKEIDALIAQARRYPRHDRPCDRG
jgi:hypothetical protein